MADVLQFRAHETPNATAFIFLRDGESQEERLSYAELDRRARALAAMLGARCAAGSRVLLLHATSLAPIVSFFGCLYAGVLPVMLYPPEPHSKDARRILERTLLVTKDADAHMAVTTQEVAIEIQSHMAVLPELSHICWIASDQVDETKADAFIDVPRRRDGLAFLQYTSGSTSMPKGVLVTNDNLMKNCQMYARAVQPTPESVCVSWLPIFHDMGLICHLLFSLYAGVPCVIMSPAHFVKKPLRWLAAITRYRGSFSCSPNFGYDLCARKITPNQKRTLQLGHWQVAQNAAEPIRAATMDRFCEAFESVGFKRSAFFPAYGLAEATVYVASTHRGEGPRVLSCSRSALERHRSEPPQSADDDARLVGCGSPDIEQQVAVVDPESRRVVDAGQVGEIWLAGPNITSGYWRAPDASAAMFQAKIEGGGYQHWLRTGDLGFLHDGQLFISGRQKDLIIVAGRNHYPQDIELTVEQCHIAVRPGCCIAFGFIQDEQERVVIAAELRPDFSQDEHAAIKEAIVRAVAREHEIGVFDVLFLEPGAIPKTSSGKVQRAACRKLYLEGSQSRHALTTPR